jgi:hypothetical protein
MRFCGDRTQRRQHEGHCGLTRIPGVSRRSFAIGLATLGCAIPIVPSANGAQSARIRRIGLALGDDTEGGGAAFRETLRELGYIGQCCKLRSEMGVAKKASFLGNSRGHFEEFVDEPILTPDATPAQPPHLALPNYVHRLIALNRSSRSLEFTKPLLSVHSPFDRAMVLLDDVVQILDGSVAAPAAEGPFLLYVCDGRAVDRRQIRVDDAGLRMRSITQRVAKQPFGGIGVAQCGQ